MPSRTEVSRSLSEDDYPGMGRYAWRPEAGGLEWSPGLVRIYGRPGPPASEAEFMACLHPDDRLRVEGETEAFLSGSSDEYSHSFRILRPDGEVRYILDRATIVRDADGRATEIRGINIDVTDFPHLAREGMNEESRSAEVHAEELQRLLSDREWVEAGLRTSGLALADVDYRTGTCTLGPEAARLYGLGDEATTVPREDVHAVIHPEDRARIDRDIAAALDPATGGRLEADHRVVLGDGAVRWLRVRKRIHFETVDGRRVPGRGVLAVVDITDSKLADFALRESETRLSLAQRAAGIGVWDVDVTERRSVWSPELYDMLRIERETPATPDLFFKHVHPDDAPGLQATFERAIAANAPFHAEFRVVLPDGAVRHMIGRGSATAEKDGRVTRYTGVNYDISGRKTAELDLRESEARLRLILDETSSLVGIVGTDGTLREVNRVALRVGGLSREDVVGKPFWDTAWWTHDPAEVARLKDAVDRALRGEPVRFDARIRAGDGSIRDLDFALSPVRNEAGEVVLLVPSALDITERKRTERRLADREAQLALFVEHAPMAIAMFDRDLRYIAHSGRYATDHDLPEDIELTGRLHYDVVADVPERWRATHDRVLAGETLSAEEDPFPRADGRMDWVRWKMAPWYGGDGEVGGAILVSEVITGQVEARRALKASEARYRALFESIDAGFCVVEVRLDAPGGRVDYRVVEANPAFYERTGFPREILGRWLREAAPALEDHWYDIYGGVARTGEPARFEEHSEHLGRWFDVFAFRIDRPEDRRVAILFHDISDRKRHEAHVGTLLKEVNHRSKNMLALVKVIAGRTTGEGHEDFLARFSDRLAALAANQDVLVYSDWESVDLERLVRVQLAHFGDLLDTRILIDGPALTVFPETAEKLGMALHELATNAGKYGALSGEAGQVRISWQTADGDGDGAPRFTLRWREEGGPEVRAPDRLGFGSQLSGAVLEDSLDGTVRAEYPSEGFSWTLSCPLASLTRTPGEGGAGDAGPQHGESQGGVLVVDNDPLLAMSFSDALREAGFDVIGPARSTDRALALIARSRPDCAILDVNLGGETSERVALELRRLGVPFVCVSGYSAAQIPAALRDAPLLAKPVDDRMLTGAVRALVGTGGRSRT